MPPRKIINIYNDLVWKHGNVTVKDFRKYEKLDYEKNKMKLDIDFRFNNNYVINICSRQLL